MYKKLSLAHEVLRSPKVRIACFGDEDSHAIWKYFVRRHPKFPLLRLKTFGSALQPLPRSPGDLMQGSRFSFMRRQVRKAEKLGYSFRAIEPLDYIDDIMRINLSSIVRQGGKMTEEYTEAEVVRSEMERSGEWFGVFSRDNRLEAYAYVPVFGDVFVFWKILGSAQSLDDGIMYFLVAETLRTMVAKRTDDAPPFWAMYDMYIGGGDGLREFKRRTGFAPHRVEWVWMER